MRQLSEDEFDSQVVEAEPELRDFAVSGWSMSFREELAEGLREMFDVDVNVSVTNWDRNLSYPRDSTVDYSYQHNLYRQLISSDVNIAKVSWIQMMDLAYVAGELGHDDVKDELEELAEAFELQ